ncbi:hypothetical protein L7F22_032824 [Adiantum nelumboides]|nr:hypothetical protein [Adiantum nelumboides]
MGKLLQKLVNGMAPSWLTKVKTSPNSSPKKLLPFFRGGSNNPSSNKSPSSSTEPPPTETTLMLVKSSTSNSSSSTQRKASEAAANDDSNPKKESHHSENVKKYKHRSFQSMLQEDDILSQSQTVCNGSNIAADELKEKHRELQHMQEDIHHHAQSADKEHKELQHMQEAINYYAQSVNEKHKECQHMQEAPNYHAQLNDEKHKDLQHMSQETQWDYHETVYQEMLGFKRKSRSLQSSDEGNDDDEELEEGRGAGDVKRWVWKRRKGEKGLMSCELPQSICSIVGNGRAVVKQSLEPHLALWESMVEMIVGNGLWELGNLEFLLYCYLSLNEPHLHPIIQSSFLQVLKDLERIS